MRAQTDLLCEIKQKLLRDQAEGGRQDKPENLPQFPINSSDEFENFDNRINQDNTLKEYLVMLYLD